MSKQSTVEFLMAFADLQKDIKIFLDGVTIVDYLYSVCIVSTESIEALRGSFQSLDMLLKGEDLSADFSSPSSTKYKTNSNTPESTDDRVSNLLGPSDKECLHGFGQQS